MSKSTDKMMLSSRARKLLDLHGRAIDQGAAEITRKHPAPAALLGTVCTLLNLRQRYVGATGEHFSVNEYEGIQVIDALDEQLLKTVRAMLQGHAGRSRRKPEPKALALLAERLSPAARDIPQYPVGYMIHYMLTSAVETFDPAAEATGGFDVPQLETAMVHHLLGILEKYVQSREKPVSRHFSDVAREYSVVMRLRCSCGTEGYDVKLQALCHPPGAEPYDRLDLQCRDCGAQRSITFDLPHFRDMYQI